MSETTVGKAGLSEDCENVHVLNELDIPIFAMGVKNLIIAAGPDGILVSDKDSSSYIKPYVDKIDQQVMFAEKSWGSYRVLDAGDKSLVIKITIKPGDQMNYHSHDRRDEVWTVVTGRGRTIVEGMEQPIKAGDVITMAAGCKHTVIAETELVMIEVQLGKDISVKDKKKYELV
jgi:mannose-1-phosphate guanylyltransferase